MRIVPSAALILALAALAAHRAGAPVPHGPMPLWALFTFAVSAFREPLR